MAPTDTVNGGGSIEAIRPPVSRSGTVFAHWTISPRAPKWTPIDSG